MKICPKCKSMMVKTEIDRENKRIVNRCLNCLFKGDELFEDIPAKELIAKKQIKWRKYYQN